MAFSCDLNTLLGNSKCFLDPCITDSERESIEMYLRIKNLAAAGGTDYSSNLTLLLTDAKQWQILECTQRKAISLYIDMQNAITNGAVIDQDINSLKAHAACYQCVGEKTRKNTLEFLKCAINTLGKPD